MRCVEAWSMVIPWMGFPLARLHQARRADRQGRSTSQFTTLLRPAADARAAHGQSLDWPYVEGLRMDEAMHPLTLLAVGLYGKTLPNQNGAPIRLVVPWKYGFKSIKSIVKIRFVEKQPTHPGTSRNPQEYGFYSNVNPEVDHPRWTQARERRIGEFLSRAQTLMFNGYADQVASALRRHGSEEELLRSDAKSGTGRGLPLRAAAPFLWLATRTLTGRLGLNPMEDLELTTGIWALRFLVATLLITPLRRLTDGTASFSTGGCSACSPSSTPPSTLPSTSASISSLPSTSS